ncbi:hypothetical protein, partial [Maribacter arenosus]
MNRKILILIFLLFSGFAFSQTTVNLEDQCNCEVLSGPDVTAPGTVTPAGADTGDIYVNTNTGTIYFWDGDSWELTSTDSQQVLDFSYDTATRGLTLELENGGAPITAILPAESLTTLTLNGNSLEYLDENNITNLIPLNVGNLTLGVDGNSLDYTDEAGLLTNIPLNVGALTFNAATRELTYIDEAGTSTVIILPAETVTNLVDNLDGTITYTNEDGTPQTINKSSLTDLGSGIYSFDNGDGSPVAFVGTDSQTAAEVNYDNTTSGLVATDVQAAIDEINAAAGTVALVDNGDGTYTFTDAAGGTVLITDTSISTLS